MQKGYNNMKVKVTDNAELANQIRAELKTNLGYCPCKLIKNKDTKCMCKDFIEMEEGMCHCGLYIKEK